MASVPGNPALQPAGDVGQCGAARHYRWSWWPLFPLATLAGLLTVGLIAWALGAPWWSTGSVPYFWPFLPVGVIFTVVLVLLLVRWTFWSYGWPSQRGRAQVETADEILRERFARGEINTGQFHEMLKVLDDAERHGDRTFNR